MKWLVAISAVLLPFLVAGQFANTAMYRHRAPSLSFSTAAQSLYTWNCSSVLTVQNKNASGVVTNVSADLVLNLAGTAGMTFYSDSNCSNAITTTTILSGQSSASFYFLDNAAGTHTITISASAYTSIAQSETVTTSPFIWLGGGGNANWSTAANWSGGAAPGTSDLAIFNSSCVSNCSPTITASIDVGGIKILSGYNGTITQSSGASITVHNKNWYQESGTFVGSSSTDNIILWGNWTLAGGSFTSTRGSLALTSQSTELTVKNSPTFNHNSGTLQIDNCGRPTMTPGSLTFNNLYLVNYCNWTASVLNGTLKVAGNMTIDYSNYQGGFGSGGTINLSGNITSNSVNWGIASDCNLRLVGGVGSSVTVSMQPSGSALGSLEIASLGTVSFTGMIPINGNFTYTSGTVDAGTSNFHFGGGGVNVTFNPSSMVFYDVTMDMGAYYGATLSGTMHISHDLTMNSGDGRSSLSGGTLEVQHNVYANSPVSFGSAAVTFAGSAAQAVTFASGADFYSGNVTVNTTGGATLSLGSDVTWNSSGQTLTVTSGSVDMAAHNLTVKALSLNGTTITRNGGVLTVNGTVVGAGTVSAYGGTIAP